MTDISAPSHLVRRLLDRQRTSMIILCIATVLAIAGMGLQLLTIVRLKDRLATELVTQICDAKHALAIQLLTEDLLRRRILFHDFQDAWEAERQAYDKACWRAA